MENKAKTTIKQMNSPHLFRISQFRVQRWRCTFFQQKALSFYELLLPMHLFYFLSPGCKVYSTCLFKGYYIVP